jgi:hypothetical protein
MDVLDLEVAWWPALGLEEKIDTAAAPVFHLRAHPVVGGKAVEPAFCQGFGHKRVRPRRVDPDELPGAADFGLHNLPREGKLAQRIGGSR